MEPQTATTPRLVRSTDGRMVAGVCRGIADHFNIDPVIVRIGFVVATFFSGAGVLAYFAAWLLIPADDETTSIGERIVREHRWARIAGIVLIAMAISSLAGPVWWFGGKAFFPVVLIIGGLYLLSPGVSLRRDETERPASSSGEPPSGEPPTTQVLSSSPAPPLPPRPRRRGGLGALTFGLLFVGAGVVGIVLASGSNVEPTYVFAAGLLIVGAALVASTWFGRSYALLPLGVVLAGLMSVSTVIDVPITGGVGERNETPFSVGDLKSEYHLGVGDLQLDLTHVDFVRGRTYEIKATVGIGHVLVHLPRNVTAELHGHSGLGEVRFINEHDGGAHVDRDMTFVGVGAGAGENQSRVVLDLEVGIGQVEVVDAAS